MPTKRELVSANRNDLARVVERYGGLYELAQMLNFEVGWCPSWQMRGPLVCAVCWVPGACSSASGGPVLLCKISSLQGDSDVLCLYL